MGGECLRAKGSCRESACKIDREGGCDMDKNKLDLVEGLNYSTIQIDFECEDGRRGSGTGFFVNLEPDSETHRKMLALVTNKHVVRDAKRLTLVFTLQKGGAPQVGKKYRLSLDDFRPLWVFHPDEKVDLCALQIGLAVSYAKMTAGVDLMIKSFERSQIADKGVLSEFVQTDDVFMIGYPCGIRDEVNNQPIFRRGSLATNPQYDFRGDPDFLIDMPVYPGSSGSPVVGVHSGLQVYEGNPCVMDPSFRDVKLLGVVHHTMLAGRKIQELPVDNHEREIVTIPNNLGIVVKADRILELEPLFGHQPKKA